MSALPLPYTSQSYPGSQWTNSFQFLQSDGQTLLDISGYTFEVVVRTSTESNGAPLFSVSSAGSTADGSITISLPTSTITVVFTPTATALLSPSEPYAITFWSNPGTSTANVFANGSLYSVPVSASV